MHYAALVNFLSNFVIVVGASNTNQRQPKMRASTCQDIEGLSLPKYALIDIIFLFVSHSRCCRHAARPGSFETLKARFKRNTSVLLSFNVA